MSENKPMGVCNDEVFLKGETRMRNWQYFKTRINRTITNSIIRTIK